MFLKNILRSNSTVNSNVMFIFQIMAFCCITENYGHKGPVDLKNKIIMNK